MNSNRNVIIFTQLSLNKRSNAYCCQLQLFFAKLDAVCFQTSLDAAENFNQVDASYNISLCPYEKGRELIAYSLCGDGFALKCTSKLLY